MEEVKESDEIVGKDVKYTILKELSYGGKAEVYLVKKSNSNDNIQYAAKVPNKNEKIFDEEIEISKKIRDNINCKYLLKFIESGEGIIYLNKKIEKKKYIIFEFVKNRDIGEYIRFKHIGFDEVYSKVIFYKIIKGIQSIHDKNICHRDIKLDNILLDEDFNPKIGDFGYATENSSELTEICGTYNYLAPEVIYRDTYDGKKADIFSLGLALIGLTTGKYKFYNPYKRALKNEYLVYELIVDGNKEAFFALFGTSITL